VKLPKAGVILAAAGEGRRLGYAIPKALVPIAGRPMFLHSVLAFSGLSFVSEIALVLPPDWISRIQEKYGRILSRQKVRALVPGGARRQDSVLEGLRRISAPVVLVHDAARPLIRPEAIRDVALAAWKSGAAVLAAPAIDTVKIADRNLRVVQTPDRSTVWLAQTPQGFRRNLLLGAYRKNGSADATDDVQLVERTGRKVVIVPSQSANFKVTTPEDLERAKKLLDRL
jgi:2-C-methyl-D-erythritol 4-phosphate cytidylyltransferase